MQKSPGTHSLSTLHGSPGPLRPPPGRHWVVHIEPPAGIGRHDCPSGQFCCSRSQGVSGKVENWTWHWMGALPPVPLDAGVVGPTVEVGAPPLPAAPEVDSVCPPPSSLPEQ